MSQEDRFKVLFVDDEQDILDSLQRSFRKQYNIVTANSGQEALDKLASAPFDLVLSDQRMPEITGTDVLKCAYREQPDAIRILLTGYSDMSSLVECVNEAQIYKYIAKPWDPDDLRITLQRALESLALKRQLRQAHESLESAYLNAVTMLGSACEGKDETTGNHVRRVQFFTQLLAVKVGVDDEDASHMGVMSILHDVGKVAIPDSILKKPGKLTAEEWEEMKRHSEYGAKILGEHPYYGVAKEIALNHHENFDGSGYPQGLSGEEIPLSARIAKVADTFDALTTSRPYKSAWSTEDALAWMSENAGVMFDPSLIEAMFELEKEGALAEVIRELHD